MKNLTRGAVCSSLTLAAVCLSILPAVSATPEECLSEWKTADVNANGALTQDEDTNGYIAAATKSGKPLIQAATLSRDEFLQLCAGNAFAAAPKTKADAAPAPPSPSPAASRDMGKGDITPTTNPLGESEARSKLTANGFREIKNLTLDQGGVWRGTAMANGQQQDVQIDGQGDVVANPSAKADSANPEVAQATPNQEPTAEAPAPPAAPKAVAPPAPPAAEKSAPAAPNTPVAAAPQSVEPIGLGVPGPGALMVWTFLLIGNAIGLVILSSMTSGGTSAMGSGKRT